MVSGADGLVKGSELLMPSRDVCLRIFLELKGCSEGEAPASLERTVQRLVYELVARQVLSLLRHRHHEKSVVIQDAAWRALRHLHQYDGSSKFSTWCWTVCWRAVRDHDRATVRFGNLLKRWARLTPPTGGPSAEEIYLQDERARALQDSLSQLTADERAAVVLYYFEDLPLDEVAAILSTDARLLPVKTVQSRLNRARAKLRRILENDPHFGTKSCRKRGYP